MFTGPSKQLHHGIYSQQHYIHSQQPIKSYHYDHINIHLKKNTKWVSKQAVKESNSFETCDSDNLDHENQRTKPDSQKPKQHKLKVELCRNYLQKGYCPYESRCKFAHGIEELRARDTAGTSDLYRTRKCKIFFEKQECKFGERCNFIHESRTVSEIQQQNQKKIKESLRINFEDISFDIYQRRSNFNESRLMKLLGKDLLN